MNRRGASVLVLALWVLFFLAALAVAVGAHVAAGLRLGGAAQRSARADALARAGVQHALYEILNNETNWNGTSPAALGNDEAAFRENDTLPGGAYTVYYTFADNAGGVATNYGVVAESAKLDINRRGNLPRLARLLRETVNARDPEGLAARIVGWPEQKKRLASAGRNGYGLGAYQSLHELLLVEGISRDIFERMAPHVTPYGPGCYGAVALGQVWGEKGDGERVLLVSRRIRFVFNARTESFLYWHEE